MVDFGEAGFSDALRDSTPMSFGSGAFRDRIQAMAESYGQQGLNNTGVSLSNPSSFGVGSQLGGGGSQGNWLSNINWMDKVDPKTGMITKGAFSLGLGAAQAGVGAYLGNKQLGLAKDQFSEAKRQFGKNFSAQVQNYNTSISDRQNRRYTGAGGAANVNNPYQATDAYMEKNRMVG